MNNKEYENAYFELLEILKCVSEEDFNKIPKDKIEIIRENANYNHNFKYDPNKTLDENHVLELTKSFIALIFRDYWATDEQRKKIFEIQNYAFMKMEEQKRKKYNPNDIFN